MSSPKLLLVFAVAVALAGCSVSVGGKLDVAKADREISKGIETQLGARVRHVTCPKDEKEKKGDVFTCVATGVDGSHGRVTVTQTNDKGRVSYRALFLSPRRLEQALVARLGAQYHLKNLTVACPEIIEQRKGVVVYCRAVGDGQKARVLVKLTNNRGGFDYKPVPPA